MKKWIIFLTMTFCLFMFIGSASAEEKAEPQVNAAYQAEIRDIIKSGRDLKIGYVSLSFAGTAAVDGLIAVVDIGIEESKILSGKNYKNIEESLKSIFSEVKHTLTKKSIDTVDTKSVPPTFRLNEAEFKKIVDSGEFDIIVSDYMQLNEHPKYQSSYKAPLKIDVGYFYHVYVLGEKVKTVSFEYFHEETSEFNKDQEQKAARKKTAEKAAEGRLFIKGELESFFEKFLREVS